MDWLKAGAAEQGRAIMSCILDPVAQTEAYLDAIKASPYRDRIYARVSPDRACAEAIASHDRAKAGMRRSLLDGVALSWKDNIDSARIATEAGSRLLEGRVPQSDAVALANATAAGTVCLGKTHLTELAFSGLGLNPSTATPPNALDAALVAGGSSSGAAVSVAMGLAAAAIGTDTGGSIRVPAAWNGLVGFKPTHEGVPSRGVVPLCRRFDVVGPLTRNVEDCAEILALLRGGEPVVDLRDVRAAGLRIMVLDGVPFEDAEAGPVQAFEDAISRLSMAGASVTRAAPRCVGQALDLSPKVFAPEAYGLWREQIEDAPELMFAAVRERFRGGKDVSTPDYVAAWESLSRMQAEWATLTAGFDAVVLPSVPILPPDAERLTTDSEYFTKANLLTLRNTRIANLLRLPAVTLPTGQPACGVMAMGASGADRRLLRVAAAMEAALAVR